MKIAIDVSQMCYVGSGVARYTRGLVSALLTAGAPHTFTLYAGTLRQRAFFTNLSHTALWDQAEWRILPVPPVLAGIAFNNLPIPFEYMTGPVDLIHTSDWTEPYARVPLVTTVHDLVFRKYPATVNPLILATQTRRLARLSKNNTHIIADSVSTKNDLMEIYQIKTDRISVIYPGLDQCYTPQSIQEIDRVKKKYNLPDQFILSVGTQEPRKNLTRLAEAVRDLELPLVLTGRYGWGHQNNTPGVLVLGFVDERDLPALYSAATVFAYPSLYEGFGFPPLEAMACGTPVVTSTVSSLPEVAGKAGVLVDQLDVEAIRVGITQAIAERDKLIPLGLKQAKQFTWAQTAREVLKIYEQIINH